MPLGGAGVDDVEGGRPVGDSSSISCGSTTTMPSNSRPLVSSPVSTTSRESGRAGLLGELRPRRDPAGHLADARRRHDDRRPCPPASRRARRAARAPPASRSSTRQLGRRDPGRADRVGQVGVEAHPLGVLRRELVDLRGVAVVGREVEVVPGLVAAAPPRERPPTRPGTGHDDWAGSPTIVQVAPRPRRPTIRHCIGVRSCASSTSTCAKPSSSMRLVGGRPATRAGVLPVGGGEHLVQGGVLEPEVLVVDRARVHDRRVADQVAQLVEQGDVVDGEPRPPPRDPTTSRAAAPTRRPARPR